MEIKTYRFFRKPSASSTANREHLDAIEPVSEESSLNLRLNQDSLTCLFVIPIPESSVHATEQTATELHPGAQTASGAQLPFQPTSHHSAKRRRSWKAIVRWILAAAIVIPILQVAILRFIDPPFTTAMLFKSVVNVFGDGPIFWHHTSANRTQVARSFYSAVVAGEDQRFFSHHGFDFIELEKAQAASVRNPAKAMRGASTLTQQTAKNLFLLPVRSIIRKAIEAYYTLLLEALWPKSRILEVYGNVVELGPGIYGVEAAAQYHFHTSAAKLTSSQSAALAAVLPNPIRWSASKPSPYIRRRMSRILRQMQGLPVNDDEGLPD